jgi:hypothetical protein
VLEASAVPFTTGPFWLEGDPGVVDETVGGPGPALSSTKLTVLAEQLDGLPAGSVARA